MTTATSAYDGACPVRVRTPAMRHRWDDLTFLHWPYDPDVVARLLPPGLRPETFDGSAWIGLVPFRMEVRPPLGPALPGISHFPETNVRTYVTAPDGSTGVWFLSLDAAHLAPVVAGRITYRMPYFHSDMDIAMSGRSPGSVITYTCRRRRPGSLGATSRLAARIGLPIDPSELTPFEHYLTARWRLYSHRPDRAGGDGTLSMAEAEHLPWPLRRMEVLDLHDELVAAAGLPAPKGAPIVHGSAGVAVRIGAPRRLRRGDQASDQPSTRRT